MFSLPHHIANMTPAAAMNYKFLAGLKIVQSQRYQTFGRLQCEITGLAKNYRLACSAYRIAAEMSGILQSRLGTLPHGVNWVAMQQHYVWTLTHLTADLGRAESRMLSAMERIEDMRGLSMCFLSQ